VLFIKKRGKGIKKAILFPWVYKNTAILKKTPHSQKRNDIYTTILQQLFNNFISHAYIMFLFSLILFLSLLFLTNINRGKRSCHKSCHY